jgi:hypothetical protein
MSAGAITVLIFVSAMIFLAAAISRAEPANLTFC